MSDLGAAETRGVSAAPVPKSSTETDQVIASYVTALGELSDVPKARTANAGSYQYSYADLAAVLGEIRPILAKHDLALSQSASIDGGQVEVVTWIWHRSGQWLRFPALRLPAGQTAQQTGSAITYARRYSAMAVCGLASGGDDDDGAGAASHGPPPMLSTENVDRFIKAATDAGVSVAEVVFEATNGRTSEPSEVFITEVQALRDALAVHSTGGVSQGRGGVKGVSVASRPAPPQTGEVDTEPLAGDTVEASPDLEVDDG